MISFCEIVCGILLLVFVFLSVFAVRRWPNPRRAQTDDELSSFKFAEYPNYNSSSEINDDFSAKKPLTTDYDPYTYE